MVGDRQHRLVGRPAARALSANEGEARLRRLKAGMILNVAAILISAVALIVFAPIIAERYFVSIDPHVAEVVA